MASFLLVKYQNELKTFKRYLKETRKRQTASNIHQLRVSIKKLRALNTVLLPFIDRSEHVKYMHLFDRLFKSAGSLRETQINMRLAAAFKKNYLNRYLDSQKSSNKIAKKDFRHELKHFDADELVHLEQVVHKSLTKLSNKKQLQNATNCLTKSLNKIEGLVMSHRDDRSLHAIRKNVRRCNEMLKLLKQTEVSFKTKKLLSGMSVIQKHIGDWHDQVVLLESVKEFLQNHGSAINLRKFVARQQLNANLARDGIYDELQCELPTLIEQSGLKV